MVEKILKVFKKMGTLTKNFICTIMKYPLVLIAVIVKKGDYVCTINDRMQELYPKMQEADLIIFGTPIYWFVQPGQ